MSIKPTVIMRGTHGLNNAVDPTRLVRDEQGMCELSEAINIDIDGRRKARCVATDHALCLDTISTLRHGLAVIVKAVPAECHIAGSFCPQLQFPNQVTTGVVNIQLQR